MPPAPWCIRAIVPVVLATATAGFADTTEIHEASPLESQGGPRNAATEPQVYKNEIEGYSLTVPPGWTRISDTDLRLEFEAVYSREGRSAGRWDAGYHSQNSDSFGFPRLIVMTVPYPGRYRPRELNEARQLIHMVAGAQFSEILPQGKKLLSNEQADNFSDATKESATFNDEDLSFQLVAAYDVKDVGRVKALLCGWLGRDAVIEIACYSTEDSYGLHEAHFRQTVASFRFSPQHKWSPATVDSPIGQDGWENEPAKMIASVVFWAIAIAIGGMWFRRRTRMKAADNTPHPEGPEGLHTGDDDRLRGEDSGPTTDETTPRDSL